MAYSTFTNPRKPMNKVGKVTRRRLALVAELKEQAEQEGWITQCEIGPILRNRGITFVRCMGELTFCHARKSHRRSKTAEIGTPEHDLTVARGCSLHHMNYLDNLAPDLTCKIVMEAIARRTNAA